MARVEQRYKDLGLSWHPEGEITDDGYTKRTNFLGMERWYWNNLLYGSSTFCLVACNVIAKYPLTETCFPAGTELWVFAVPENVYDAAKSDITNLSRWLCLPVNAADEFPSYNWTPCPLQSPEDATQYLTGWSK